MELVWHPYSTSFRIFNSISDHIPEQEWGISNFATARDRYDKYMIFKLSFRLTPTEAWSLAESRDIVLFMNPLGLFSYHYLDKHQ